MMHKSGMHHGEMCCSAKNTSGWGMMNKQERADHRSRMKAMKSYEECKTYADEHHEAMIKRAKESGRAAPASPRRDPCSALKK
jgi:hypothetical protein